MIPETFDRKRYDELLSRGLPSGMGDTEHACIMACLNLACGGKLTDAAESPCVLPAAARFAIRLNDASWSSELARAEGLRDLGLALLGTKDIDGKVFLLRLAEATIREVVPVFLRRAKLEDAAKRCEAEGTAESARSARKDASASSPDAAYAAAAAAAAADAADAAAAADASYAAADASYAAYRRKHGDETLILSAKIATRILTDMKREADIA